MCRCGQTGSTQPNSATSVSVVPVSPLTNSCFACLTSSASRDNIQKQYMAPVSSRTPNSDDTHSTTVTSACSCWSMQTRLHNNSSHRPRLAADDIKIVPSVDIVQQSFSFSLSSQKSHLAVALCYCSRSIAGLCYVCTYVWSTAV